MVAHVTSALFGPLFPLTLAMSYLGLKLLVRFMAHRVINEPFDWWSICAWTGVDASILIAGASVTLMIPQRLAFRYGEIAIWYSVMAVMVFICIFFYMFFTKRRRLLGNNSPFFDLRCVGYMILIWGTGLAYAGPTINAVIRT